MTVVVIPVANEDKNLSLPYAVASIRKHTAYDILTVGGRDYGLCPHLNTGEPRSTAYSKFNGEAHALRAAIDHLGEPLIYSADDIYWLRPAEPVRWAIGKLEDAQGSTVYAQRKRATAATLHALGFPTHDYEAHVPMLIDPKPMTEALALVEADPQLDKRSLYGNLTGLPDIVAADVKVRSRRDPLPDTAWASTEGTPTNWPALMAAL